MVLRRSVGSWSTVTDGDDRSSAHNVSNGRRNKRDASDAFTEYHSKMTMASRIFSGIALRIGLYDGSVNGDSLISELLNLSPSFPLDDVEKFDKAKLDQFFKDVAGLNDPARAALEGINKIWSIGELKKKCAEIVNPMDRTGMDEYIGKVKTFKDADVDFSFLGIMLERIQDTQSSLVRLPAKKPGSMSISNFGTIRDMAQKAETFSDDMNNFLSKLAPHDDLLKPKILKSDLVRSAELIEEFYRLEEMLKMKHASFIAKVARVLSNADTLSSKFNDVQPHLKVAEGIVARGRVRKVAHGFVNGFADIIELKEDVEDTWLATVIENYDQNLVKTELKVFEQFESSAKNVEAAWMDIDGWRTTKTLTSVLKTFGSVNKTLDKTIFTPILEKEKFDKPIGYATLFLKFTDKVLDFRKFMVQLRLRLDALHQLNELKELKNLTAFHNVIDFSHSETADEVLQKLPSKEHLSRMVSAVETIQKELTEIKALLTQTDPKTLAGEIEQEKAAIQTFLGHADRTAHFKYFDEVKALRLGEFLEPISLLKVLEDVKKKTATFQPALEVITTKISASIADFKALRAVPAAIKATKSKRTEELVQLKSIEGAAKTFGDAVMVLDVAEKVLSQKVAIKEMLREGWNVTKLIANSTEKEALEKDWGVFGEIAVYFGQLITELENKTSSLSTSRRARRQTVSLKDLVDKLTALQGLPDFHVDLKPKVGVLKQLTGGAQLLSTMESLAALDLHFSSHQSALASAGQEVDAASKLFRPVVRANSSSPSPGGNEEAQAPNSKDPTSSGLSASGDDAKDEKAEDKDDTIKHVIGGILGVIAVVGIAGGAYGIYRCFKKDPPKETTPVPANDSVDGSKTDEDKKGGGKQAKSVDSDPMGEVDATPKLADLEALSTKTAKAKTVVEENFDMSAISEAKRAMANDYKDCVQVMMEDKRLRREKAQMSKKEANQFKEEVKKAETKIPQLKKLLGVKLVADVEKFAHAEYEENITKVAHARARLESDKLYDSAAVMKEKSCHFAYLVMTPLAMARETLKWVIIEDVWVPPPRLSVFCFKLRDMLLYYDPLEECIMMNLNVPFLLNPYHVRLQDANDIVDKMKQPCTDVSHLTGTTTVQMFEKYAVRLDNGRFVNATWFDNKYGDDKLIVCAAPGVLNDPVNILNMLWQEDVEFTATLACLKYFDPMVAISDSPYKCYMKDQKLLLCAKRFELWEQKVVITFGGEERTIINYDVTNMKQIHTDMSLIREERFRNAIRHIVRKTARQADANTVFFDTEGSCWAGILVGIELISSSLSHDGLIDAHLTTQLVKILSRRGRMFTYPDQVMFTSHMAVDMFLEDHKQPQLGPPYWKSLEICDDEKSDMKMKVKAFGEKKAENMRMRGDESIENVIEFVDKDPALTAKLNAEKETKDLWRKYEKEKAEQAEESEARKQREAEKLKEAIDKRSEDAWEARNKTEKRKRRPKKNKKNTKNTKK